MAITSYVRNDAGATATVTRADDNYTERDEFSSVAAAERAARAQYGPGWTLIVEQDGVEVRRVRISR